MKKPRRDGTEPFDVQPALPAPPPVVRLVDRIDGRPVSVPPPRASEAARPPPSLSYLAKTGSLARSPTDQAPSLGRVSSRPASPRPAPARPAPARPAPARPAPARADATVPIPLTRLK